MSYHTWELHGILGEGLYRIRRNGHRALWARARIRKASRFKCEICSVPFSVGDLAYHPIGNQMYRQERLCPHCVEESIP